MQQFLHKKSLSKSLSNFVLALFAVVLSFGFAQAQDRTISGKVSSSEDQSTIPGVNVIVKGSANGAITDVNGEYKITVKSSDVLVFSFVGFISQEVQVGERSIVDVVLVSDTKQLEEVVVTAFGIEKGANKVGFATQKVAGSDLVKAREPSAVNSLVGKVAGLSIGSSPELLGRPNVVLRGNSDVLFVVNGVPVNSDSWNLSADDIESYTVLKGANAAALYGFRGQNGAIIITTKKGSRDSKGWSVDFNSSTMVENGFTAIPKPQHEYGRGTNFTNDAFNNNTLYDFGTGTNNRRYPEWGPRFEGQLIKQYDSPLDPTTKVRTATPWLNRGENNLVNFLEPGLLSTNNLSLSTGGENFDIRVSGSHTYQKGLSPNTKLNIDNLNITTGINFAEKWRLDANVNVNVQYTPNIPDVSYGPNSYVYMFGVYASTDYDVRDLKDYYKAPMGVPGLMQYNFEYGRLNNPYFMAYEWTRSHNKTDIYGSTKLTYTFNKNLNLSLRTQLTTWNQVRDEHVPAGANLNAYTPWWYLGWYGDYRTDKRNVIENNTDLLLNFNKEIGDWSVSGLVGASSRSYKYESFYGTTKALAVPGVYSLNNSQNPSLTYNWGSRMDVYSGYYSVDLAYKKFFNISHTGRVDNLSTLPAGKNTFYYPSASISSALTDFITFPEAISFLKIHASYADVKGGLTATQAPTAYKLVTGNNTGDNALLGYGSELYSSYDGPSYANQNQVSINSLYNGTGAAAVSSTLANQDLKTFDVQTIEAGIDARFVDNRIGIDFTYFTTKNGPGIVPLTIPSSTGYTTRNENALTTRKTGFELALKGTPIITESGFRWDVLVNYATFKETLETIGSGLAQYPINGNHNYKEGERVDAYYSTGFVRDPNNKIVFNSSGTPLKTPGGIDNNIFLGNLNPDFTFGINNKFAYKNWSFSFQFDGRVGGIIYDRVWYQMMNGGAAQETVQGAYGDARLAEWQSTANGTKTATPAFVGDGTVITSGTANIQNGQIVNMSELTFAPNTKAVGLQSYLTGGFGSSFDEAYMISRTYAKLREVTIGYKIPLSFFGANQTFIKSASISLVGRNLLYFAARKDFDIDQYASGYNASTRSYNAVPDLSSPTTRRYGININLTF